MTWQLTWVFRKMSLLRFLNQYFLPIKTEQSCLQECDVICISTNHVVLNCRWCCCLLPNRQFSARRHFYKAFQAYSFSIFSNLMNKLCTICLRSQNRSLIGRKINSVGLSRKLMFSNPSRFFTLLFLFLFALSVSVSLTCSARKPFGLLSVVTATFDIVRQWGLHCLWNHRCASHIEILW